MFLDRLIRLTVLILIVALPWLFGGVFPNVRAVACGVLAVCLFASALRTQTTNAWASVRWQLIVLCAAVTLGFAQLNDSVTGLVNLVDSGGVEARHEFSASAESGEIETGPISLHPPATRREIAGLVSAVAAFLLGAALFAETKPLLLLMIVTAVNGAGVALFGIVQQLTWNGLIYWTQPTFAGQPFGPFVNRNNAGGFLELSFAAAIGLLIWRLMSIPPLERSRSDRRFDPRPTGVSTRILWILANLDGSILCAAAGVLIIASAVLISLSRGSFVALSLGTSVGLLIMAISSRRAAYIWILTTIVAASIGFTIWLGRSADIQERLATLFTPAGVGHDSRLDHWKTALQAVPDYWVLGSGLGTYRYAYLRFQESPTTAFFRYAENQYLDALVSAGAIGLTLMLLSLVLFGYAAFRLVRRAATAVDYGPAATAIILLLTQTLHACFDFALYVPANYLLFALLCGALSRRAVALNLTTRAATTPNAPSTAARISSAAMGLVMTGLLVSGAVELTHYAVCRSAEETTRTTNAAARRHDLDWIDQAIAVQSRAAETCPDDGEARVRLAELWVERYKAAFRREVGNFPIHSGIFLWANPEKLYADAHLFERIQNESGLQNLRRNALVTENLLPALNEARAARRFCPMSPYAQMLVGKLCFLDEPPSHDVYYLDLAESLIGSREQWLFELGALHLDAGRPERTFPLWRRCLEIDSTHEAAILHFASGFLTPRQIAEKVLPDSPETLARIARSYYAEDERRTDREFLLRRALAALQETENLDPAGLRLQGSLQLELGNFADSVSSLERAIARETSKAEWYFDLAAAYAGLKQWERAESYVRLGLLMDPHSARGQTLLKEVSAAAGKSAPNDTIAP